MTGKASVAPLALGQFVASFAATSTTVAITDLAHDIGTTVAGVQTAITLFTLTMAALMVPGSKLTDIFGRKKCFIVGLLVYGTGAMLASVAGGLGMMLVGYSLLQGVGSALLIPPIYILATVMTDDPATRARYFGVISAAGGLGAAAGPLLGGLVTSQFSWRANFVAQVVVVAVIVVMALGIQDRPPVKATFDVTGAVLSAAGLCLLVSGVLRPGWVFIAGGMITLYVFWWHINRSRTPLVSPDLFRDLRSNLGLVTQGLQWLVLQGAFFVLSVYLQQVHLYSAVGTGLVLLPATVGLLLSSFAAKRLAKRWTTRRLVRAGFSTTAAGILLLLLMVRPDTAAIGFAPGLFLLGVGVGVMLTASVNLVQSAWPDEAQGEISGVSRSVSNLGSSLGVAVAGSILLGGMAFGYALLAIGVVAVAGVVTAVLIPRDPAAPRSR